MNICQNEFEDNNYFTESVLLYPIKVQHDRDFNQIIFEPPLNIINDVQHRIDKPSNIENYVEILPLNLDVNHDICITLQGISNLSTLL